MSQVQRKEKRMMYALLIVGICIFLSAHSFAFAYEESPASTDVTVLQPSGGSISEEGTDGIPTDEQDFGAAGNPKTPKTGDGHVIAAASCIVVASCFTGAFIRARRRSVSAINFRGVNHG